MMLDQKFYSNQTSFDRVGKGVQPVEFNDVERSCMNLLTLLLKGSWDGTVVRALASHQCGPGSFPGPGVICGLSLSLVLVLAPRVFLRVLRFSSLHKNQHFQIPSGISRRRATLWRCHCKFQFIY